MMSSMDCPNCGKPEFKVQDQTLDLTEILRRWESEAHVKISPATIKEFENSPTLTLFQCEICEFNSFIPPISGTAHFYSDITRDDYYVSDKWEFKKVREFITNKNLVSILDVGCGQGAFLKSLMQIEHPLKKAGFDFNPNVPKILKQNNIRFENDLSSFQDSFDLITAFQIIEHLSDPFSFIKKLSEILKPNSYLVITVPNLGGPIRHFPTALTEIPPHHVTRWTAKSMEVFVERAGFKVETILVEPMAKIFWKSYIPAMIENALSGFALKAFHYLRGPGILNIFLTLLEKLPIGTLPLKGHSFLVVAKKCAE